MATRDRIATRSLREFDADEVSRSVSALRFLETGAPCMILGDRDGGASRGMCEMSGLIKLVRR